MSIYEAALLIVGGAVLLLSLGARNWRGAVWVAAIMADLIISTAYWRANLPYGDVFTGACDFSVCLSIFTFGRWRWELGLFLLYQFSLLISIIDLGAAIWSPGWIDHDTYSSLLEAVNYIGFLGVGGISGLALGSGSRLTRSPWRWLRPAFLPLFVKDPTARR